MTGTNRFIQPPELRSDTQVQVTGSTLVALLDQAQRDPEYKLGDLLNLTLKLVGETYLDRKRNDEYHQALDVLHQLLLLREGGSNTLQSARRPPNHELVPAAIRSVTENVPLIERVAPQCLDPQTTASLTQCALALTDLEHHRRRAELHALNLNAVESNLYGYAGETLGTIHGFMAPTIHKDRLMGDRLLDLAAFCTSVGKASSEGRQHNEKIATKAVAKADADRPKEPATPPVAAPQPSVVLISQPSTPAARPPESFDAPNRKAPR